MDRFCTELGRIYAGSQLAFPYTLTRMSGIGATIVEVRGPAPPGGEVADAAGTKPSTPIPPKPSTHPAKGSRSRSKKAHRYCDSHHLRFVASCHKVKRSSLSLSVLLPFSSLRVPRYRSACWCVL